MLHSPRVLAEWSERANRRAIPPSFSDPSAERQFIADYRLAGLQSVVFACSLGIAAYVALGAVEIAFAGWNAEATFRRMIAVALLAFVVVLIATRPFLVLRHYSLLLGSVGAITVIGLISVIHLLRDEDVSVLVNPVSLLALWILYGFVRLPLHVAISVGLLGSGFSMFGSRLTNMQAAGVKTFIYLLVANAIGILLARSIEIRERKLFLQKLVAESAQIELAQRTMDAENASAEKTRLLAAVAHDLRQPMLSAVLHSEVLRHRLDAGDASAVKRQALRVEESVKVLGETLEHLLVAARYDAGTEPVEIGPVALVRLFHRLREVFDSQAISKGIELRICEPRLDLQIETNEQALFRILMNLVSNAIKFTEPKGGGGGVLVKASVRGSVCRIVVADTGVGIEQSNLSSIWQPFFQVGNEERNRSKGLGLGLYIVQQSIRRLNRHSISVRSSSTLGSRFVVEVPQHVTGGEGAIEHESLDEPSPLDGDTDRSVSSLKLLHGRHVLLIEDDSEARNAIEALLNEWGLHCSSGVDASEVLARSSTKARGPIDWIVADFRLPGPGNGVHVITEARRLLGYESPAILVSAEVDRESLIALLPPSTTYVQKPFEARSLRVVLLRIAQRFSG